MKEEYLKPREAVAMLYEGGVNITTRTLWNWYNTGKIIASKLPSGRLQYPKSEVNRILARMRQESREPLRGKI